MKANLSLLIAVLAALWFVLYSGDRAVALSLDPAIASNNLSNDILYYITVDRFYDAETDNNIPNYAFPLDSDLDKSELAERQANRLLLEQMYDPSHRYINMHWGGDLAGVLEKLDYLQALGVTKIVLSPIQDRANGFTYTPEAPGYLYFKTDPKTEGINTFYRGIDSGFKGYWLKDWFEIDEHLRSPADRTEDRNRILQQLLNAAGDRGIGVILTLPLNSTSPFRKEPFREKLDLDAKDTWFVDGGGVSRQGKRVATYLLNGQENPQGWFHPLTAIDYTHPTPEDLERGAVGGIPDLDQDNAEVERYLLEAAHFWLTFNPEGAQIAGFYIESLPNINVQFWQKLEKTVRATRPEAILIGEYPGGGYRNSDSIQWYEQTDSYSLLNYDLSVAARRFFSGKRQWDGRTKILRATILGRQVRISSPQRLLQRLFNVSGILEIPQRSLEIVSNEEVKNWVTFVESHDNARLFSSTPQLTGVAYRSLVEFIFTSPGVPMLMYGTEAGLAVPYHIDHKGTQGIGADPFNQPMMIWPENPGWNADLYEVTLEMIRLRKQYPALREGSARFLFPPQSRKSDDIFMLRAPHSCDEVPDLEQPAGQCRYILFSYSTRGGKFSIPITDIGDVRFYQEIVPRGAEQSLAADSLTFELSPEESKVFVVW